MPRLQPMHTLSLALAAIVGLACQQSSPPPIKELPAYAPDYGEGFSGDRAWRDLEALVAIGPRVSGSEGAQQAREYIRAQLAAAGLSVMSKEIGVDGSPGEASLVVTNLSTTIPGKSEDLIVLAAPYDTRPHDDFRFVGANDGGSGAALLLELARNLHEHPLHYTTRIVFLDGEALRPDPRGEGEPLQLLGSIDLASDLAQQGLLARTRLFVVFNKVADADLRIARDLYSHRLYREEFWAAAARLDYTGAFPADRNFESVPGSHHPLRAAGLQRVVAIVDTSYGGDEPPGVYADSAEDTLEHASAESLAMVGLVTLDALDNVSERLAKIDRFSQEPLADDGYVELPPSLGQTILESGVDDPHGEPLAVPPPVEPPAADSAPGPPGLPDAKP